MSKIAIDIALLLPNEIMDLCISFNPKDATEPYQTLNKTSVLPHLSLAMGVIDEIDLPKAKDTIDSISFYHKKLNLELTELYYSLTPENKKSYGFRTIITPELQNLHNEIIKNFAGLLSYDKVNIDMFYNETNERMNDVSTFWVKRYPESSYDKFSAHISLRSGNGETVNFPKLFTASHLALCHLGNFCTCRNILHSNNL